MFMEENCLSTVVEKDENFVLLYFLIIGHNVLLFYFNCREK